ncbi:MAG: deoxyribonuclease V [Phycisphaerae bacterium]|nr:deoxyribonuclease V [Phycisphaerae bacterium]
MKVIRRHDWRVSTSEAREIQKELAGEVSRTGSITSPRLIAGVDISVNRWAKTGTAAVVVLGYPGLEIVETKVVTDRIELPYIPGLLSFREAPLILAACEELKVTPDLMLVDGQGIAHPRRLGLASHLGLFLDIPTIGCAKSRLCGTFDLPPRLKGGRTPLLLNGEQVGTVLRTRTGVKPLFVSPGHLCDQIGAVRLTLAATTRYRLPEPTRLAHQLVTKARLAM